MIYINNRYCDFYNPYYTNGSEPINFTSQFFYAAIYYTDLTYSWNVFKLNPIDQTVVGKKQQEATSDLSYFYLNVSSSLGSGWKPVGFQPKSNHWIYRITLTVKVQVFDPNKYLEASSDSYFHFSSPLVTFNFG